MYEFSQALSDTLKRVRGELGLTQDEVAELAGIEVSNIRKMETLSRNANPELVTLYPLIRALNIDPQEIFYPDTASNSPRIRLLQQIISDCTDDEADALIPITRELKHFMRSIGKSKISE